MTTRWRGLLAPINTPTGDGRRMAPGAFTNRPLPLPLKWQRTDEGGHTTSVVVGSMDKLDIDEAGEAVWGEGELFDDASPTANPRLAEDVAEAKLLLSKKVIGPSVDPGSAQAVTVMKGSNEPLNDTMLERYWMQHGEMPETELLFTNYEIAAATLVPVPAFALCRPFELLDASGEPMPDAMRSIMAAAPMAALDPALFRNPELSTYTPVTMVDLGNGWTHIFGHVAAHSVCHVGMRGVCTTAPYSDQDYQPFHRYSVTRSGHELPVMAGRLTSGLGRFENLCRCHPGNDDHACGNVSFGAAIAHHDQMESLAYVCVGEDEPNDAIWFSGVLDPECSEQARKLLNRRRVSGDWREYGAGMELAEVLVLARREPGFPLPRVSVENGRQRSLTAAGVIMPERPNQEITMPAGLDAINPPGIDYDRLGTAVARSLMEAAAGGAVTAAVRSSGWDSLPVAPDGRSWDDLAAKRRLSDWAGDDISGKYARAFLYLDSAVDPDLKTAYGFPVADIIDGELTIVPAAVRNAASRLSQSDISADEQVRMRAVIERLLDRTREARDTMSKWNPENALVDVINPSQGSVPDSTRHFSIPATSGSNVREDSLRSRRAPIVGSEFTTGGPSDVGNAPVDTGSGTRPSARSAFAEKTQRSGRSGTQREDSAGCTDLSTPTSCKCSETGGKSAKCAANHSDLTQVAETKRAHDSTTVTELGVPEGFCAAHATEVSEHLATTSNDSNLRSATFASTSKGGSGHTGAMVALRMTDADAARLAVEGGLAPDDMHMTLAYLGEAADISQDARDRMVKSMTRIANKVGAPIEAEGFSISAFNPGDANDRDTAIVMGVNGAMLADMQKGVCKALGNCEGYEMPEQHEPFNAHTTLEYSDDLSKVAEYADRIGPITFDRLRLAFAGDIIDIPLGEIIKADEVEQDERDSDDQMYARMARANQLAARLWFANQQATSDHIAMLTEKIQATAPALAE